jgi:hypothetical protein
VIKFRLIRKTAIEAAVTKLKEAHKAQDLAAIELASTELNNAWTAASQDIYNAQQQGVLIRRCQCNRVLMQAQGNNKVEMVMQRMYRMCRLRR